MRFAVIGGAALSMCLASPVPAHEGHDHGAPPPAPAELKLAPRLAAASDLFEIVGVFGDGALTLYLDGYDDNQPIAKARVEVDSETLGLKASAVEVAPAVYRVPLAGLPAGAHALTITVSTAADADLLLARFEAPPARAADARPATASGGGRWPVAAAGALGVLLAGLAWVRRRRRPS